MEHDEIRPGMKVTVHADIQRTSAMWGSGATTHYMAGDNRGHNVDQVKSLIPRNSVEREWAVEVEGYWFAPEDLRPFEPPEPEEVEMKTSTKIKFDPATL